MRILTIEDVLLFLEELRIDPAQRHCLRSGGDLLSEASRRELLEWGQFGEFIGRMVDLKRDGLVEWEASPGDSWGDDLMNARDFHITVEGRREARELAARPRVELRGCEEVLEQLGWESALEELREGDAQYAQGHWTDAVADYYTALESAFKYALSEAGVAYGNAALRTLAGAAAREGLIPQNYQALFGFLDSIRSPREHGRGTDPLQVAVGQQEALLMSNHARSLLLYLAKRPAKP